jgi:AbrB family looped-hinge helix DNA binding protein
MTTLVKVVRNGQITLPKEVRRILGIEEGDFLEVSYNDDCQIKIKPKAVVDRELAKGRFFKLVGKIQSKTKNIDAKIVEREIDEAIREARKTKQK